MNENLFKFCFVLLFGFCSCHKENSSKWEITFSGKVNGYDHLELVHDNNFSGIEPYYPTEGTNNILWSEIQEIEPTLLNYTYEKAIIVEIPDSMGIISFAYEDEEIYNNLNCYIYYFASGSNYDGFYRIHEGSISGIKTDSIWEIEFEVFFGGNHNDKFQIVKGAEY